MFHHMKVIGGKNIYSEKEEAAVCIMTPNYNILLDLPNETTEAIQTMTHLLSGTSIKNVDNLTTGQTTTYKPRNVVLIPPFFSLVPDQPVDFIFRRKLETCFSRCSLSHQTN